MRPVTIWDYPPKMFFDPDAGAVMNPRQGDYFACWTQAAGWWWTPDGFAPGPRKIAGRTEAAP